MLSEATGGVWETAEKIHDQVSVEKFSLQNGPHWISICLTMQAQCSMLIAVCSDPTRGANLPFACMAQCMTNWALTKFFEF
jgi:hypothetical protein